MCILIPIIKMIKKKALLRWLRMFHHNDWADLKNIKNTPDQATIVKKTVPPTLSSPNRYIEGYNIQQGIIINSLYHKKLITVVHPHIVAEYWQQQFLIIFFSSDMPKSSKINQQWQLRSCCSGWLTHLVTRCRGRFMLYELFSMSWLNKWMYLANVNYIFVG